MSEFHTRKWSHITDLPSDWESSLRNSQTEALVSAWHEQADELKKKGFYHDFLAKLKRQWSIETGVIEGIYSLSEGATTALIEKGLDASFISHNDTDDEPQRVIEKIQDHQTAIDGIYDFVSGGRQLSTSYIKELHGVLCANQHTYHCLDTLGNWVERELPKGCWKAIENHVKHPDGSKFEYCPVNHVANEMDNLVEFHLQHLANNVPADIQSAWLHHRFAVIHPFTDGNGRVARCLATMVLLRDHWLPLVVTRLDRDKYIAALRSADTGDLAPLVNFVGNLQRKSIREAFSLSDQVIHDQEAMSSILASVKQKFSARRQADERMREQAIDIADSLFVLARETINDHAQEISTAIGEEGHDFKAYSHQGERDSDKSKFYYKQIVDTARHFDYYANFNAFQAWVALVIQTSRRSELVFSFHGIGTHASGVFGCNACFFNKDRTEDGDTEISELTPLGEEPFEFTYTEDAHVVQQRFQKWLDVVFVAGLQQWQKYV